MINPMDPSLARSSSDDQNLKEAKRKVDLGIKNLDANAAVEKEKKLREAAEGFEAIFIQQMWQAMRASLPKEGLMHSREEQFWQGIYDQELGKSMASAGGIGLADMMMTQLSKKLQNASEVAAETMRRSPLEVKPVPLMTEHEPNPIEKHNVLNENIYEGEVAISEEPVTSSTITPRETLQENLTPIKSTGSPVEEALHEFSLQQNKASAQSVQTTTLEPPQPSVSTTKTNTMSSSNINLQQPLDKKQ